MNITETIRNKKAMLDALENIMNTISRERQNYTENLEMHKDDCREFVESYSGNIKNIEDDWTYKYKRQDIDNDTAMIAAYDTIQKALEKLI